MGMEGKVTAEKKVTENVAERDHLRKPSCN